MFRILFAFAACVMLFVGADAQDSSIPPEKPFTFLLITADGGYGNPNPNPLDQHVRKMVAAPNGPEMDKWQRWASLKELPIQSPIVRERHSDLVQRATGLPILALVDSTNGAVWDCMSGNQIPQSEHELAKRLDVYFAATMKAAEEAAHANREHQVYSMSVGDYQQRQSQATNSVGGWFDIPVNLPDQFDLNANATVEADTRVWGTKLAAMVMVGLVLLALAIVASAWIVAEALTEDDGED